MSPSFEDIFALAKDCVTLGTEKGVTFGTAESCTGGLIGGAITAIAGSSTPFKGGIIAYDDAVKFALLSVRSETLGEHGAVSEATACEMAEGLRGALGVDLAISATGIAGPDGGSGEKPVGTVWIGIAKADGISASPFNYGNIGRGPVRDHAVLDALRALRGGLSQV